MWGGVCEAGSEEGRLAGGLLLRLLLPRTRTASGCSGSSGSGSGSGSSGSVSGATASAWESCSLGSLGMAYWFGGLRAR